MPTSPSTRYHSLDLWRGVACLLVLLYHASFWGPSIPASADPASAAVAAAASGMWIGVPMFFAISGYCIAATADATRNRGGVPAAYFHRRLRRIFPPYWIVLGTTCLVVAIVDTVLIPRSLTRPDAFLRPWWYSGWQWFGTLTLTETWRHHFVGGPSAMVLPHAWTLCYEEQFYLVVGFILVLVPKRLFAACIATTVLTIAAMALSERYAIPIGGFFFDGGWLLFFCGILVYLQVNGASRGRGACIAAALIAALAFSLRAGPERLIGHEKNLEQNLATAAVFALAIIGLHRWDRGLSTAKAMRPLMLCGQMCYSLYLVHLPICTIVKCVLLGSGLAMEELSPVWTIPLCAAVAIPVAWAFHIAVERRFMGNPPARPRMITREPVPPHAT